MDWQSTPFTLPLLLTAATCLVVGYVGWRRARPGATALAFLMVAVAIWAGGYALELSRTLMPDKVFWAKVQYLGIATVPIAWMVFCLRYVGLANRVSTQLLLLLAVEPVATLLIVWNPETDWLIWSSVRLDVGGSYSMLELRYGPWLWLHAGYSYAIFAVGSVLLIRALMRSPHLYRKQGFALLVAAFAPWVGNVLHLSGLNPVPLVDPTPFAFAVTGMALMWALLRQQFLDIMPVARAAVFDGLRDGVLVLDSENRIVDLNPEAERVIGKRGPRAVGHPAALFLSLDGDLVELFDAEEEVNIETVLKTAWEGDEPSVFGLRSWPLRDAQSRVTGRVVVLRDITEQKQAEAALRESEDRLRVMVEQMPAVLWATDSDLCFTSSVGTGLEALGLKPQQVVGQTLYQYFDTDDPEFEPIATHLQALQGRPSSYELEWMGREFQCHVEPLYGPTAEIIGTVGVAIDATELVVLQEQLRQSQKMEAIGRMAGGVAHDFNNLLTAVAGYAELAQQDMEHLASPDAMTNLRRDIDAIQQAAERATSLTGQLLAFSRRQVLQPTVLELNAVIEDMDKMVRRMVGGHIELATILDPELQRIKSDPVQLQQVIVNLVLNSRDAMPNGGTVTIETTNLEVLEAFSVRYEQIEPGSYVMLAVTDDGFGMDDITQTRLFEPFYTTKDEGKGTGLGLATVYGIVKQSGGYIEVQSTVGQGTTFKLYFPAVDDEAEVKETVRLPEAQLRGAETVLLVEDEDMVRTLATRMLNSYGYKVLVAADAVEAIEACELHEGPIHLVITDVVMPGMSGKELADRLATIVPDTPVLFVSGYTGGALIQHGVLVAEVDFLQKPFAPDRLMRKVRGILDRDQDQSYRRIASES